MTRAVIALGSNLGHSDAILRAAVKEIGFVDGTRVVAASAPVESVALTIDGLDESKPLYLNGAAIVETSLEPLALLDELNRIEDELGRVRLERWGDRTLDLDLVVFGDVELDTPRLTLPHPRAHERSFVLEPWAQIQPDAVLPGHGPIASLLARLEDAVAHVDGATVLTAPPAPVALSSHGGTA
ncbi:2-amino-4-hydroxy-6-hydroxymethyldihydropteridine diphosphokinase [Frondihabitans sp. PhB188]|uniref:2-amino-4-hydroxy-6- hydroxymethyldihydropteridine diphosphokinase n=1 Tax=Frondihabitans sp. PhB188 TaxID=2485200 RepID=UPI000F481284|nr:2-amino-4-hydroxy-6-hydroxymethyldihydropteridine diphosphokinase [Frondihabitans sp. PhB188]ROQ37203.1 2-amino-4-hydroxy-6-hydroxymethyldihydropteridine diphosphokinase [Frondihabitans sp. PhB188]